MPRRDDPPPLTPKSAGVSNPRGKTQKLTALRGEGRHPPPAPVAPTIRAKWRAAGVLCAIQHQVPQIGMDLSSAIRQAIVSVPTITAGEHHDYP